MQHVILGQRYRSILDAPLREHGFMPIYMPDNPYIDKRLAGHADLSVFKYAANKFLLAPHLKNTAFSAALSELGAECSYSSISQSAQYPNDTQLNACCVGEYLFCAKGITDTSLLSACRNCERIYVKQGYCRCSICTVGNNAIICADAGIVSAAKEKDLECLHIVPGYIELEGFSYGFIGGASFAGSNGEIYFTGRLEKHPNGDLIQKFINSHGFDMVFLTNNTIFDIGTCIII